MTALNDTRLDTLATSRATRSQKWLAGLLCFAAVAGAAVLWPILNEPTPTIPAFVALNQATLVIVYGLTTHLFFAQFMQTRSIPVLVLGVGSMFTCGMVFLQLLCFPNVLTPGLLMGNGPDSLIWLWTFWHLGPPLFALPYAIMEGDGRTRGVTARQAPIVATLAGTAGVAAIAAIGWLVADHVDVLPKNVVGDDYHLLTTSGVGPAVELLTVLSLAVLCWTTKLRTTLQLWLAASLFLLIVDNAVTDIAAARGTVGWVAGRICALVAGISVLGVYLRELDDLRHRAEIVAGEREKERARAQAVGDSLALALEATGMCDWELDLGADTTRRTAAHDRIFGYGAMLPRWGRAEFLSHVVPDDRPNAVDAYAVATRDGRLELECRIERADSKAVRWVSLLGRTYYDRDGRAVRMAGCLTDSTERRQTDERLRQAERMEAVGQLTGGVAHDFNNLLTVITGSLELMGRAPGDARRIERCTAAALAAAQRGADVTAKLLAFSRRQVVRPEVTNLNRRLQEFLPLMRQAVSEQVTVTLDLDASLDPARVDPQQFEAALLNLLANARDAMPSGGRVTVTTSNATLGRSVAEATGLKPGTYASVSVTDTGFGMDPATARTAFEPFFTTKEVGKGTGLGLSQVYGFAQQAGGIAQIDSAMGQGTTVTLLLPHAAASDTAARPANGPKDAIALRPASDGEVVLVVEDDPEVLAVVVENLHDLGYRTLTADTAAVALERLRSPERIDLLFSDVVMPGGMNGVQLAVVARTLRDRLRVVLTSGFTASALAADHELPDGTPLLSKPYARRDLAETLHATLTQG